MLNQELPALVRQGYTSYKLYMTYRGLQLTDRQVLDLLCALRREQAMAMVHAENAEFVEWLTERLVDEGLTSPKHHTKAHPVIGEREAVHRAMSMSELVGAPIVLVHISAREVIEQIDWARRKGLSIYAETCPQYLVLTEDDYDEHGFEGAKLICTPPPRTADDQQAVWQALARDALDLVSSDHSPFRFADPKGKQIAGADAGFHKVPNGVPGVETRLPLLYSEGVLKGRIDINQFVRLTATNPAKLYGLYPRKGTIAIGSDADLVIWNEDAGHRDQRHAASCLRLHAVRRDGALGLASGHPVPRPTGVPRWRAVRRSGARRVPGLRAATCGAGAAAKPYPGADTVGQLQPSAMGQVGLAEVRAPRAAAPGVVRPARAVPPAEQAWRRTAVPRDAAL